MKKGFTLIELLVVVLVIGILAAIAVPGYQGAVDKSRYSALMPVAKNIKDAQERVLMSHANYTGHLSDLDIESPGVINGNTAKSDEGAIYKVEINDTHKAVRAENEYMDNAYVLYLSQQTEFPDEVHCEALTTSARANKLCQSLNGRQIGTNGANTVYVLEGSGSGNLPPAPSTPGDYNNVNDWNLDDWLSFADDVHEAMKKCTGGSYHNVPAGCRTLADLGFSMKLNDGSDMNYYANSPDHNSLIQGKDHQYGLGTAIGLGNSMYIAIEKYAAPNFWGVFITDAGVFGRSNITHPAGVEEMKSKGFTQDCSYDGDWYYCRKA